MTELALRDRELVALGAMGSNCVPCVEHHIPESRKAGLTDAEIRAAVEQADKVRQVPARRVLAAALAMLTYEGGEGAKPQAQECAGATAGAAAPCGCS